MKDNLRYLLIDELHDQLSSETQIVKALPLLIKGAESPKLKAAFTNHLKETKGQIVRLKKVFKLLKVAPKKKLCKATKGLIDECKEVFQDFKTKSAVRDAAIISKAQRIEHYEISAYGTLRTFARDLGLREVAKLLQETEDQEANADKALTKIAQGGYLTYGVNQLAERPSKVAPKKTVKRRKVASKKKVVSKKKVATKRRNSTKSTPRRIHLKRSQARKSKRASSVR